MEGPLGRNVLNGRVVTEQIVSRDLFDLRVGEDGAKGGLQSFDVRPLRCHEDVEGLGEAGQTVNAERDRA